MKSPYRASPAPCALSSVLPPSSWPPEPTDAARAAKDEMAAAASLRHRVADSATLSGTLLSTDIIPPYATGTVYQTTRP